jgi:hypothetical protein
MSAMLSTNRRRPPLGRGRRRPPCDEIDSLLDIKRGATKARRELPICARYTTRTHNAPDLLVVYGHLRTLPCADALSTDKGALARVNPACACISAAFHTRSSHGAR